MSKKNDNKPQQSEEQLLEPMAGNSGDNVDGEGTNQNGLPINSVEGPDAELDGQAGATEATQSAQMDDAAHDAGDEAGEPSAQDAEIESLREELRSAQAKADEYLDQLQRTAAEFQNSRKRQEKQLADAIERANGSLVARLLPILDDFDLAFANIAMVQEADGADAPPATEVHNGSEDAWLDGFRQISKKVHDILRDQGLQPVEVSGEFDPVRHEAIASEPSDEVESGHIVAVLRAGYEYKGRVIRPAMVRVAA